MCSVYALIVVACHAGGEHFVVLTSPGRIKSRGDIVSRVSGLAGTCSQVSKWTGA